MHTLVLRPKAVHCERAEFDAPSHPRFSHATWAAIVVGGAGIATSLYGANKQSKAQGAADASNRAAAQESDLNQWKSYLMQRGLNPAGVTAFGQVPTNAAPMNTNLPLWANMTFNQPARPRQAGASMVRRRTTPRV